MDALRFKRWTGLLAITAACSASHLNAEDLMEGSAAQWGTFASDNKAASVADDTSHVKAGQYSLRFDTASGFDTGIKYPKSGSAHWDLTTNNYFAFWQFAINTNSFQGYQPIVILNTPSGSLRYEPTRTFTYNQSWSYCRVPLAGDSVWVLTTNGSPSLQDVTSVEIHQDTWDYGSTIYYDGARFFSLSAGDLPPPGPPPPPGVNPDRLRPRVLLFAYDPIMPNKNNHPMHEAYGWTDPLLLTQRALSDLRRSSHDLVVPSLVTEIHDTYPIQSDGFQYDADSFDYDWTHRQIHDSQFDYRRFVADFNLAPRILSGELDEIWIYCGPYGGMWESTMAGDGGYWCNSGPVQGVPSTRLFVIMGLNFERGVGEAIHSFGHRSESILAHNYERWEPNRSNTWSAFALLDKNSPGLGGIGNVHYPVNGESDYDYANTNFVLSTCDDWLLNYPNFQGVTRLVNYREWSPDGADPQRQYLNWWYAHMPHIPGRAPDFYLGNWWRYLWDPDQFKRWNGNLYATEGIPSVAITSSSNNASVSGLVQVTASASISGALGRVDLYVDGQYHASDTLAPYTFDWDTRGLVGTHTLVAKAYELQNGTEAVSDPIAAILVEGSIQGEITCSGSPAPVVQIDLVGSIAKTYYVESRPNAPIPDNDSGGITNSVPTPTGSPVRSASVGVTVRHPRRGDLELDLITPAGQRLRLKGGSASDSERDLITVFPEVDSAVDDLTSFTGDNGSGGWQLVARDSAAGQNGVLEAWSLRLEVDEPLATSISTNCPGHFLFDHLAAGVYQITPSAPGRYFWPPTITLTNIAEALTANFTETTEPPPILTLLPADQYVYAGDTAIFHAAASGSQLSYQWQHAETNLPGATEPSLVLPNVQPSLLGAYRVVVSNASGSVVSPDAVLAFAELTEANAEDWDTFASDGAATILHNDMTMVKVGQHSLWFDTASGFDTGVRYPRAGNAGWDLSGKTHLIFWIYPDNNTPYGFQGNQPVIVLTGPGGSFRYEPQAAVMPNHFWSLQQIPLTGNALWQRTQVGNPSLSRIDQLEVHQDTWDYGFTIIYDGVEFATLSPPQLLQPHIDNGAIVFTLLGKSGTTYQVEVADQLPDWRLLRLFTATNIHSIFRDALSLTSGARFYHVKEP